MVMQIKVRMRPVWISPLRKVRTEFCLGHIFFGILFVARSQNNEHGSFSRCRQGHLQ